MNDTNNSELKNKILIIGTGIAAYSFITSYNKPSEIVIVEKGSKKISETSFSAKSHGTLMLKSNTNNESFGGTSNLWSGNLVEMQDYEQDSAKNQNMNLWFLENIDLSKLYKHAWKLYNYRSALFRKSKTNLIGNFIERKIFTQRPPLKTANKINLNEYKVYFDTEVVAIGEKNGIPFAKFKQNHSDQEFKFQFKKIVVCSGCLSAIKIIRKSIESGFINDEFLKNNLGKNYMNHPKFLIEKFIKYNDEKSFFNLRKTPHSSSFSTYSLAPNIQNESKLNNTSFAFIPNYENESEEFKYVRMLFSNKKKFIENPKLIFRNNLKKSVYLNKYFLPKKILNPIKIIYFSLIFLGFIKKAPKYYDLQLFLEMEPNNENIINYKAESFESFVEVGKCEKETFRRLMEELYTVLNELGIDYKNVSTNLDCYKLEDASHHIGGLCYSKDKKKALTDHLLRLRSTNNIHICSSAIFPTSGSFNPNLTITALAIYLSKNI